MSPSLIYEAPSLVHVDSVDELVEGAYYVATTGNDTTGNGTIGNPWATLQKFHTAAAAAGDTCYMRGGTYTLAGPSGYISLSKSGSAGNLITVRNYPGEVPVIDGINLSGGGDACIFMSGSYWHLIGITATRGYAAGFQMLSGASNNTLERCIAHHNHRIQNSGASIAIAGTGSNNLLLNCDSYRNGADTNSNGGSGLSNNSSGSGNIIRGCRAWRNNDNGIELWDAPATLVENCWVWQTGYNDSLQATSGDGVGFKLGGSGANDGGHTIRNNLSWGNRTNSFDANQASLSMNLFNNTSYNNIGYNYHFYYEPVAYVLKNNISFDPGGVNMGPSVVHTYNSWNSPPGVTVSAADFITTDFTANTGTRKTDGSLPDSDFLRLVAGSDLINAGTDVGIAYLGAAPDLGAYERE